MGHFAVEEAPDPGLTSDGLGRQTGGRDHFGRYLAGRISDAKFIELRGGNVGSTEKPASLGDQRWASLLESHDRTVRDTIVHVRGRKMNTTGDGFVASFDGPARAIRCARAIGDATRSLNIDLRMGLHTGECEVRGEDLSGSAVHVAARIVALAAPGVVLVSGMVKESSS